MSATFLMQFKNMYTYTYVYAKRGSDDGNECGKIL